MKINHSAQKSNPSLPKINQKDYGASFGIAESFAKVFKLEPKNDNSESSEVGSGVKVHAYNRLNNLCAYEISPGDICVIGSNDKEINYAIDNIVTSFKNDNIDIIEVSRLNYVLEKLNLNQESTKSNESVTKIIAINTKNTLPSVIEAVVSNCETKILFKMERFGMNCSLNLDFYNTASANSIINSLGGDFNIRKHFASTLSEGEFLVANTEGESVFSLFKQSMSISEKERSSIGLPIFN
jgi:hypothetical protein